MQQKHVSLYAFSHSFGEYDRPQKKYQDFKVLEKNIKRL